MLFPIQHSPYIQYYDVFIFTYSDFHGKKFIHKLEEE